MANLFIYTSKKDSPDSFRREGQTREGTRSSGHRVCTNRSIGVPWSTTADRRGATQRTKSSTDRFASELHRIKSRSPISPLPLAPLPGADRGRNGRNRIKYCPGSPAFRVLARPLSNPGASNRPGPRQTSSSSTLTEVRRSALSGTRSGNDYELTCGSRGWRLTTWRELMRP